MYVFSPFFSRIACKYLVCVRVPNQLAAIRSITHHAEHDQTKPQIHIIWMRCMNNQNQNENSNEVQLVNTRQLNTNWFCEYLYIGDNVKWSNKCKHNRKNIFRYWGANECKGERERVKKKEKRGEFINLHTSIIDRQIIYNCGSYIVFKRTNRKK